MTKLERFDCKLSVIDEAITELISLGYSCDGTDNANDVILYRIANKPIVGKTETTTCQEAKDTFSDIVEVLKFTQYRNDRSQYMYTFRSYHHRPSAYNGTIDFLDVVPNEQYIRNITSIHGSFSRLGVSYVDGLDVNVVPVGGIADSIKIVCSLLMQDKATENYMADIEDAGLYVHSFNGFIGKVAELRLAIETDKSKL